MLKVRAALLGAMALLIVSGLAASTASAAGPYWHEGGVRLEKGTKAINLQLKGTAKLAVPGAGIEIECKSSSSEGAAIEGNGTNQGQDKGHIKYTECKTNIGGECKVAEPITTVETKSYLAQAKAPTRIVDVFEPEKGTTFVELKLSSGCKTLVGPTAVKGSVAAEVTPEGTEVVEGDLQFPATSIKSVKHEGVEKTIELKVGATNLVSTFSAGYGAKLVNGNKFGVSET